MRPPVKSFIKVILFISMAATKTRKMKKIIMVVPEVWLDNDESSQNCTLSKQE